MISSGLVKENIWDDDCVVCGGWFLPRSSMLGLFLAAAASSRRQVPKNHLLSIIFWDLHGNHALLNQDCHKTPGLTRSSKLEGDLEREGWSMTCPFRLDDSVLGGDPSRLEPFLITNIIIRIVRQSCYWCKGVTPMWSSSRSLRSPGSTCRAPTGLVS